MLNFFFPKNPALGFRVKNVKFFFQNIFKKVFTENFFENVR